MLQLVSGYRTSDPEIIDLLKKVEFHFLPMANPDGYEYTRSVCILDMWHAWWQKPLRFILSQVIASQCKHPHWHLSKDDTDCRVGLEELALLLHYGGDP